MIWASAGGHFLAPAPDLFITTVTAASAHTYVLYHWLGVRGLGDWSSLGSTAEGDSFTTMLSCDTDIVLAYRDHVPRAAAVPGLVGVCRLARRVCGTSHTFTFPVLHPGHGDVDTVATLPSLGTNSGIFAPLHIIVTQSKQPSLNCLNPLYKISEIIKN